MENKERFEVLLEDLKSDTKAIADGQGILQNQIEELKGGLRSLDKKLEVTSQALYGLLQDTKKELNENIDRVENTLGEKIDRVEGKLDSHMKQPAHA